MPPLDAKPSACSWWFHHLLPWMIGVGTILAGISIILFLGQDPVNSGTAIGLGVAGNTILGAAAIGRWIANPTSKSEYDTLTLWLTVTFLFLLTATLCAAFNVDGVAQGLGIAGALFACFAIFLSNAALKYNASHDGKDRGFHVTGKFAHLPIGKDGNPLGLVYPENIGLPGSAKPGKNKSWKDHHTRLKEERLQQGFEDAQKPYEPLLSPKQQKYKDHGRRLSSMSMSEINQVLSTLCVTLASLLVWYLYFKNQDKSSQDKSRRRTTIIKKRPTFVKGKRRASHRPTLSTLRSEGNLLAN